MRVEGSVIGGNGSGLEAKRSGVIFFNTRVGASQVTDTTDRYSCDQDGKIFADVGAITGAVSTTCLTVGGPVTH
jgi:hypothetical protein